VGARIAARAAGDGEHVPRPALAAVSGQRPVLAAALGGELARPRFTVRASLPLEALPR
jgi:hypothetical protein